MVSDSVWSHWRPNWRNTRSCQRTRRQIIMFCWETWREFCCTRVSSFKDREFHLFSVGSNPFGSVPPGRLEDSVRFYQEALGLARQAGDQAAVKQIQEGLKEVKKKRSQESNDPTEEAAQ
ncbi:hypothetical protein GOODEAATRI_033656 [Goodea atripinnis]|uniref:Uncharacterized protein n=1 Tax=Goodea atripinnis TaxID=208336 RepID=A0ABV0PJD1_9TELE